jgi:hypothetical protein
MDIYNTPASKNQARAFGKDGCSAGPACPHLISRSQSKTTGAALGFVIPPPCGARSMVTRLVVTHLAIGIGSTLPIPPRSLRRPLHAEHPPPRKTKCACEHRDRWGGLLDGRCEATWTLFNRRSICVSLLRMTCGPYDRVLWQKITPVQDRNQVLRSIELRPYHCNRIQSLLAKLSSSLLSYTKYHNKL